MDAGATWAGPGAPRVCALCCDAARDGNLYGPGAGALVAPKDGGQIVRIQSRLAAAFPQYIPPANPGMPYTRARHLGFFQTQEALDEAERQVRAELTPLRFVVQEISYFVRKTDGGWEEHVTGWRSAKRRKRTEAGYRDRPLCPAFASNLLGWPLLGRDGACSVKPSPAVQASQCSAVAIGEPGAGAPSISVIWVR